jgi:hypothetical protein
MFLNRTEKAGVFYMPAFFMIKLLLLSRNHSFLLENPKITLCPIIGIYVSYWFGLMKGLFL